MRWVRCLARILAGATLFASAGAAFAAPDYIDSRRIEPVRDGDVAAGTQKATVCLGCHGENGISPASIFPNLRGQSIEYLYWMLVDFKRGKRPMSTMTPLVAPLSDQDLRDLAAFYAQAGRRSEPATPVDTATDSTLAARGEQLYLRGDATLGIPPCQGCHGVDAGGHPLVTQTGAVAHAFYRTYPALRAQKGDYLVTRLKEYREGNLAASTNAFIMAGVSRHLDDESINALAAWLSAMPMGSSAHLGPSPELELSLHDGPVPRE